jgi:hypothetical protein
MGEQYDLLIRGGTVVDGTGAPARRGDVGVRNGKIAAVGEVAGTAAQTLDADGAVVAPGFVDIHTHYDAGVLGSHAHRIAVARRDDRGDGQLRLRRRADAAGAPFSSYARWRTSRHVDRCHPRRHRPRVALRDDPRVPRRGRAARHGDQRRRAGRPHRRAHVRDGEEATERAATDDEIAAMRAIVADGLRAGAIGFATSWSPTHVGYAGRPVPSRVAELKEIERSPTPSPRSRTA